MKDLTVISNCIRYYDQIHFSSFAECHDHGTQQRIFLKKIQTLPSAGQRALGKDFFFKKNQTSPSAGKGALGKEFLEKK